MTPTTEGKQLAADLANAAGKEIGGITTWRFDNFDVKRAGSTQTALARLATEHLSLKAKHEEALADLREIWGKTNDSLPVGHTIDDIRAIAAKYRVETDPLGAVVDEILYDGVGRSPRALIEASLKRGIELSKRGYEIGGKS